MVDKATNQQRHPYFHFRANRTSDKEEMLQICIAHIRNAPVPCLNINRKTEKTRCDCLQHFDNWPKEHLDAVAGYMVEYFFYERRVQLKFLTDWISYTKLDSDTTLQATNDRRRFLVPANYRPGILRTNGICKNAITYLLDCGQT